MQALPHSADSRWRHVVYASGNLGKSVVWTTSETFLIIHLITQIGLPPATAGTLLALILIVEGFADIVVGTAAVRADRGRTPSWHRHATAAACGFGFWLVFADLGLDDGSRTIQAIGALLVCRCCYTMCDVAHNALIIRLAQDPRAAATIAGTRLMFSALGTGLVGAAASILVSQHGWGTSTQSLTMLAGAGGLLYAVLVPAALSAGRVDDGSSPPPVRTSRRHSPLACLRHREVRTLLYLVFLQTCTAPLLLKMLPFVSETMLSQAAFPGMAVMIVAVSQVTALPCWTIVGRRMDARDLLVVGHGVLVMSAIALTGGMAAGSMVLSGAAAATFGVAQAALGVAIWARVPITAKELEHDAPMGDRVLTGLFLAALKWGSGIGTGVLGLLVGGSEHSASRFGVVLIPATVMAISGSIVCLALLRAPALHGVMQAATRRRGPGAR